MIEQKRKRGRPKGTKIGTRKDGTEGNAAPKENKPKAKRGRPKGSLNILAKKNRLTASKTDLRAAASALLLADDSTHARNNAEKIINSAIKAAIKGNIKAAEFVFKCAGWSQIIDEQIKREFAANDMQTVGLFDAKAALAALCGQNIETVEGEIIDDANPNSESKCK